MGNLHSHYSYIPGQGSDKSTVTAMVHGVCHSGPCFNEVAHELSERGIGSVVFTLESEYAGKFRNCIGLGAEVDGVDRMLHRFQEETGLEIHSLCGHSKGGRVIQKLQNKKPEWRLPTVLMAPVPTFGIGRMLLRFARHHPAMLAKTLTGELRNAMQTDEEIRTLFGDAETPQAVIDEIRKQMSHTSYLAYLQLFLPQRIKPDASRQPVLLMMSGSDALFPPSSYRGLEKTYPDMIDVEIEGGHDFFMTHPMQTASHYAAFHHAHTNTARHSSIDDTIDWLPVNSPKSPTS